MWIVIAIGCPVGADAEDIEIGNAFGPFPSEEAAVEFARDHNDHALQNQARAKQAQAAWNARRGALFGDKWPLTYEESAQLGQYPLVPNEFHYHVVSLEPLK